MLHRDAITYFKSITVFDVIMLGIKVGPIVGSIWVWGLPYLDARAAEYFAEQLIEQGLDPEEFKKIPDQVRDLSRDQNSIQSDLATIKAQNRQLLELLKKQVDVTGSDEQQ